MRKTTTTKMLKEVKESKTEVFCDICGKQSKNESFWDESRWWSERTEVKVSIKQQQGQNYPEGGAGTEIIVDLCPQCFKEKLIPWLNSQGANVKEREWDW